MCKVNFSLAQVNRDDELITSINLSFETNKDITIQMVSKNASEKIRRLMKLRSEAKEKNPGVKGLFSTAYPINVYFKAEGLQINTAKFSAQIGQALKFSYRHPERFAINLKYLIESGIELANTTDLSETV